MAAESALAIARTAHRRNPGRAPSPPIRVYQCRNCGGWHLTHKAHETAIAK
jgi:hypothetical protein